MQKIVITVTGQNRPGMVAAISVAIARCNANIIDMNQRISGEHFVMLMIVDLQGSVVDLSQFQQVLATVAKALEVRINVQHEDVYNYMHRLVL